MNEFENKGKHSRNPTRFYLRNIFIGSRHPHYPNDVHTFVYQNIYIFYPLDLSKSLLFYVISLETSYREFFFLTLKYLYKSQFCC